jgi:hypothetical protein
MSDRYNERSATLYNRAHTITINNPHHTEGLNPSIHFYEQLVSVNDDGSFTVIPHTIGQANLDGNPSEWVTTAVPMLDMGTRASTGKTFTIQDFASMVYSLYAYAAQVRDEEVAAEMAAMEEVEEGSELGPFDAGNVKPEPAEEPKL